MLGSPILYLKAMRLLMFQLSGFYYKFWGRRVECWVLGFGFRGGALGSVSRVRGSWV